ncbi:thyrotropin-releasing hormone receptor-like [Argopecten irradians]|uniref:thyrotropin-releasing hormone receptor-like n=1 Tax=Argopecten irradians TaxID=31199 RepID=UPI003715E20F
MPYFELNDSVLELDANISTCGPSEAGCLDTLLPMENSSVIFGIANNGSGISSEPTTNNYTLLFKTVSVTIAIIIFIVGFVGNILVVLVVWRTKSMHTPTNCYLLSLSVADCLVLLSATLPAVPEPFYQVNEWPWGHVMCSILIFLQYLGVDASALSMTAFTVERYIAICHPMKAQRMCTVKRAMKITAGIWIFTIMYTAPWLGLTMTRRDPRSGIEKCTYRLKRNQYLFYYMTDLIAFYVLPLIIAACLYGLIARILFSTNISKTPGGKYKENGQYRVKKNTSSRKQVVRMLIVIVGVFATLWLPYRAMVVYNSFSKQQYLDIWFLLFCRVMIYINSAINPILYNAMSVKFRRAFQKVLCCVKTLVDFFFILGIHNVKQQIEVYSDGTCFERTTLGANRNLHQENTYLMLPPKNISKSSESVNYSKASTENISL